MLPLIRDRVAAGVAVDCADWARRLVLFGIIALFSQVQVMAQAPAWSRSIYGSGYAESLFGTHYPADRRNAMTFDAGGNVYLLAQSNNGEFDDQLVVKYGANGSEQWRIATNYTPRAIKAGENGYIFTCGYTLVAGVKNYVVVKYDPKGIEQWRASPAWNGRDQNDAIAIALDAQGNVIVSGNSNNFFSGGNDFLTVKFDAAGTQVWQKRTDGASKLDDKFSAMAVDAAGNVYVTGSSQNAIYYSEWLTVKISPAGDELWRALIGNSVSYYGGPVSIDVDATGNVAVAGDVFVLPLSSNYLVVKYGANGAELWRRSVDGDGHGDDHVSGVRFDSAGNIVATGTAIGSTGADFLTIKYSSAGSELWRAVYSSSSTDQSQASSLAIDAVDNVYVAGINGWYRNNFVAVKYSSAGVEQWRRATSDSESDQDVASALVVTPQGRIAIGGTRVFSAKRDFVVICYDGSGAEAWHVRGGIRDGLRIQFTAPGLEAGKQEIVVDGGDNLLLTGTYSPNVYTNGLIVKLASNGGEQWRRNIDGGPLGSYSSAIATDAAGNVFVTGWRYELDRSIAAITQKYDAAGNLVWARVANGLPGTANAGNFIALDSDGSVIVTGTSGSSVTTAPFTVKYDSGGTVQWSTVLGAFGQSRPVAMTMDTSGNVYVLADNSSSTAPNAYQSDFITVKYSRDGAELWRARVNGAADRDDVPVAVGTDGADNVYVVGNSRNSANSTDILTVKYNASGAEQWRVITAMAGSTGNVARAATVSAEGRVVIAGSTYLPGAAPGLVVALASNGVELWQFLADTPSGAASGFQDLRADPFGNYYGFGLRQVYVPGGDAFVIKLDNMGRQVWQSVVMTTKGAGAFPLAAFADMKGGVYVAADSAEAGHASTITVAKLTTQTAPGAPTIVGTVAGDSQASFMLSPPLDVGGGAVRQYAISCEPGPVSATNTATTVTLRGLVNETTYRCSATSTNAYGVSAPSISVDVTPSAAAPLVLLAAGSRKSHGSARMFDVPIAGSEPLAVEPRDGGGGHYIVFTFNKPVSTTGSATLTDLTSGAVTTLPATIGGYEVGIHLADIVDAQRVTVSVAGINGSLDVAASLGFLAGDVTGSGKVTAGDIAALKARLGPASVANFRFDINVSGAVDARDVSVVKSRAGRALQ